MIPILLKAICHMTPILLKAICEFCAFVLGIATVVSISTLLVVRPICSLLESFVSLTENIMSVWNNRPIGLGPLCRLPLHRL